VLQKIRTLSFTSKKRPRLPYSPVAALLSPCFAFAPRRSRRAAPKGNQADGDSVNVLEANTEESLGRAMVEILWHCRETRQQTENTNIALRFGHGEIPEGLPGSERLACRKRSVENLGDPIGSRGEGMACG
jgi:hypothetical protein